jgi:phospholipase C
MRTTDFSITSQLPRPSYNPDGSLAGKSKLDLSGEYFSDQERKHIHVEDLASGTVRFLRIGPTSPPVCHLALSRGGWVNSQVFDHTSVGQFIERRFGITIPAITPWHRAVCGDPTTALDFREPRQTLFPELPRVRGSAAIVAAIEKKPATAPPANPESLSQASDGN